jgi:hypothetical protein
MSRVEITELAQADLLEAWPSKANTEAPVLGSRMGKQQWLHASLAERRLQH